MLNPVQEVILRCLFIEPEKAGAFKRFQASYRMKQAYASDPDKFHLRSLAWKKKNPEGYARKKRSEEGRRLEQCYGISRSERELIQNRQGNACAVCKEGFHKTPHIDHDHKTGSVRGLLCFRCNAGLGYFRDSLEILESAKRYLSK